MPTYTHIVHKPDAQVQHNFSASGWEVKSRHAASHDPYGDKGGRYNHPGNYHNYTTVCGKHVLMDHGMGDDKPVKSTDVHSDAARITCNACRRKLGLPTIQRHKRPVWRTA